jgi:hypothetical protein
LATLLAEAAPVLTAEEAVDEADEAPLAMAEVADDDEEAEVEEATRFVAEAVPQEMDWQAS